MPPDWIHGERSELATSRLLDAAGELFANNGVRATTMSQVAESAGCSRATLYNHFADRQALEVAFVHRQALRLSAEVAEATDGIEDPAERAVAAFGFVLDAVRSDRVLMAWFSAPDVGLATAISSDSEVLRAMSTAFADRLVEGVRDAEIQRRGRWLLRMIVSLLAMPEEDPLEEQRLVEDLIVPAVLTGRGSDPTAVPGGR